MVQFRMFFHGTPRFFTVTNTERKARVLLGACQKKSREIFSFISDSIGVLFGGSENSIEAVRPSFRSMAFLECRKDLAEVLDHPPLASASASLDSGFVGSGSLDLQPVKPQPVEKKNKFFTFLKIGLKSCVFIV